MSQRIILISGHSMSRNLNHHLNSRHIKPAKAIAGEKWRASSGLFAERRGELDREVVALNQAIPYNRLSPLHRHEIGDGGWRVGGRRLCAIVGASRNL